MPSPLNLWLDVVLAVVCGLAGFGMGQKCSRLPKPWWLLGYFVPLALILFYGAAIHFPSLLSSAPDLAWLLMGRKKFLILGFFAAMVLATPLSRLTNRRDRRVVTLLIAAAVLGGSVWPFLAPIFNRSRLAHLQTHIDNDGICLQSTDYTCGPASAVTALHNLGLPAEEGELAVLSGTSAATGTPPDLLAEALRDKYGQDGLSVDFRFFKNICELRQAGLTLAVIKFSFLMDHYVTVLKVDDISVTVGDPLNGTQLIPREEFLKKWRFCGIVLQRK